MIARLAIVRLSAIGDVVHGLPLAKSLRRLFPSASISWITQPEPAPLLAGHPHVDRVIRFPRRGGFAAAARSLLALSREQFDLAVDLQGNVKSALVTAALRARRRISLSRAELRETVAGFLPATRAARATGPHSVDRTLALCRILGDPSPTADFALEPTSAELAAARRDLAPVPQPIIAISVGADDDPREWPDDRCVAAARALRERGAGVLVLAGPRHAGRAARIAAAAGVAVRAGTTDLRGLLAHLGALSVRGGVLVAGDSAPLHLAVAVGLRTVALAGPQDPRRTGAYGRAPEALRAWSGLPCAPCRKRRCAHRGEPRACMARIAPEAVVARALAATASPAPSSS